LFIALSERKIMPDDALTVLFVDPHPDSLEALRFRLKKYHMGVIPARTGADALCVAKEIDPVIVLLECDLPDMTGIRLIDHMQRQRKTTCIFYTSNDNESFFEAADTVGAAAYLSKSLPIETVVQTIVLTANREKEKTLEVTTAIRSSEEMEKILQSRRLRDNLLGTLMQAWQLDREEAYAILVQFSRSHEMPLEEIASMQEEFNKRLSSLSRQFDNQLLDITPKPLLKLREFYLQRTGHHNRPAALSNPLYQRDMFSSSAK
jgi:response regulator RpfG family c-di-GMP phosphodiesterase